MGKVPAYEQARLCILSPEIRNPRPHSVYAGSQSLHLAPNFVLRWPPEGSEVNMGCILHICLLNVCAPSFLSLIFSCHFHQYVCIPNHYDIFKNPKTERKKREPCPLPLRGVGFEACPPASWQPCLAASKINPFLPAYSMSQWLALLCDGTQSWVWLGSSYFLKHEEALY